MNPNHRYDFKLQELLARINSWIPELIPGLRPGFQNYENNSLSWIIGPSKTLQEKLKHNLERKPIANKVSPRFENYENTLKIILVYLG